LIYLFSLKSEFSAASHGKQLTINDGKDRQAYKRYHHF